MNEREIFFELNKQLKEIQKYYPVENIFGIYITEILEKEIKSTAVIIPLFEDICTSVEPLRGFFLEGKIKLLDIRLAYEGAKNGYPEAINALYTDYIIINPKYQHIFQKIFKSNREAIKKGMLEGIPSEELKTGLVKLCSQVWQSNSPDIIFLKQLTDAEKLALNGVIKKVGDEGTFSQAKVASAVGVSRLTMSNLIMKMKFYKIAEVTYLGNKGTYIKILSDSLLSINDERIN